MKQFFGKTLFVFAALILVLGMVPGCATTGTAVQNTFTETGFLNRVMQVEGLESRYVVYLPIDYDPTVPMPLILFLHGSGERGNDGLLSTAVGLPHAVRCHTERFPCLVVIPQCPDNDWWSSPNGMAIAEAAMDAVISEFLVDLNRVYLTGLSMGGFGSWTLAVKMPERFAAVIPICGGGNPDDAPVLATLPIRVFHGAKDTVVKPEQSRIMVEAILAEGGDIEYVEYPDAEHNSWDLTYRDADVIAWLLSQSREK